MRFARCTETLGLPFAPHPPLTPIWGERIKERGARGHGGAGDAVRNLEIARLFNEIADLLEIKDENIFKIRAYRRAAMNLESLTEEIESEIGRAVV